MEGHVTKHTEMQRKELEKQFQMQKYINGMDSKTLAVRLGLTDVQVQTWFKNRRVKLRKMKSDQLNSMSIRY